MSVNNIDNSKMNDIVIKYNIVITGSAPDLPAKIVPAKTRRLKTSGRLPTDMGIPPLDIEIMLESNPPKSRVSVRSLALRRAIRSASTSAFLRSLR